MFYIFVKNIIWIISIRLGTTLYLVQSDFQRSKSVCWLIICVRVNKFQVANDSNGVGCMKNYYVLCYIFRICHKNDSFQMEKDKGYF